MQDQTFCELFCKDYGCSSAEFDEQVFQLALYPRRARLARLLRRLNKNYFNADMELIRRIKQLDSVEDIRAEVSDARDHTPPSELFRGQLRVRVSGKRLLAIAGPLFAKARLKS